MKKTIVATIIVVLISSLTYAEEPKSDSISGLTEPADVLAGKTDSLSTFMDKSVTMYKSIEAQLDANEKEMFDKLEKTKSDTEKVDISVHYLNERIKLLEKIEEDVSFVEGKLNESIRSVHSMIGDVGGKASIAEQLADKTKEIDEIAKNADSLKRDFRALEADEPDEDSDEYLVWLEKKTAMEIEYEEFQFALEEAVQDEFVFGEIAKGLNITKKDAVLWRSFTAQVSALFGKNVRRVASSKRRTAQYRDYLIATKSFAEISESVERMQEMAKILGVISAPKLPPVPGIERPNINIKFTSSISDEKSASERIKELREEFSKKGTSDNK